MSTSTNMQLTDTVVMVRPDYFGFNAETGLDNEFQHKIETPEEKIRQTVLGEFGKMVEKLESHKLKVVVLESPRGPKGEITPDAIFPNNWFSTHPGCLVLYPMKAQNRRWERQPENLVKRLGEVGKTYVETVDLTEDEKSGEVLEGTGSLVLDRANKIAYAIGSQRTSEVEFKKWAEKMGFEPVFFMAVDFGGKPVYHTNVIMSVGDNFAIVCTPAIKSEAEKTTVLKKLQDSGKTVLEISMEQMYNMCGNILQTLNTDGTKLVIMSERARAAFSPEQLETLGKSGEIVPVAIETIETVGGGSARCMLAEIF